MDVTLVAVESVPSTPSDGDAVAMRIEGWAVAHAQAAPRLGEEQLEVLRQLFQ